MKLVVGQWLVDSSQNYITHTETSQEIKLEPRAMAVLVYFVQRPDQVISRDELIETIWEGRIVGDHAIYRVINQIRKALDANDKDAYITTLSKKGYKLEKPVSKYIEEVTESVSVRSDTSHGTSTSLSTNTKTLSETSKYGIFFGLIFLSLFVLWKTVLEAKWDYYQTELYTKIAPLNTDDFFEDYPSFSRDGKFMVFSRKNSEKNNLNIFLKDLKLNAVKEITSDDANWLNAVASNDAKQIVAIKKTPENCKVVLLNQTEENYQQRELFDCINNEYLSIEINDIGTVLYYTYKDDINPLQRIFSYQIKNGKRVQLSNYVEQAALGDFKVSLSPDNKKLAFLRSINSKQTLIGLINLEDNSELIKYEFSGWINNFSWDSSGEAIVFQNNTTRINKYSIKHAYTKPLISSTANLIRFAKSSTEKMLAIVQQEKEQYVLWRVYNPLVKNNPASNQVERIQFSEAVEFFPKYANLSNNIAFMSNKSGKQQIWIRRPDGKVRQLTNFTDGRFIHHLEWSPDDKYLVSSSFGEEKIYTVNTESGEVKVLLTDEVYTNSEVPTWSYDGNDIYFSSNKDGEYDIYKLSIVDRSITKYTDFGVDWLLDINDGVDIYIKVNQAGLWLKRNNKSEELIVDDLKIDNYQSINLRDKSIYFYNHDSSQLSLYNLQNKEMFKSSLALAPSLSSAHISISADQKSLVFSEIQNEKSKIYILTP